ncbi:YceI family protein [Pedobacter frigidisoli]|uniref:YceI family protein n=2 Tax=Pedobacter frigidisoli TaxID=2530455 RepID=A0A4R0P9V3_9SPHI|nr:YceI family protein [Pedobacter frigidisoli]
MLCISVKAQSYLSSNVKTSFFSSTPIEDIKAASNKTTAVLIAKTGEFAFLVSMKSFEFEKKLMQEHFNENYIESDKYPTASFKGNIQPNIDWSKDGEYNVVAKGILSVHGVSKPRTIATKISLKNGIATIASAFDVACVDHDIKIPTLVFTKIAKVISVKVNGTLTQKP